VFPEICPQTSTIAGPEQGSANLVTYENLFHEINLKCGKTLPSLKNDFLTYLEENRSFFTPSDPILPKEIQRHEDLSLFLETLSRRYTFSSNQDLDVFMQEIHSNQIITDQHQSLFRCLAGFLQKPIVLYTHSSSSKKEIFMPDRSNPTQIPEDALELGFSYQTKTFFSVSLNDQADFKEIISNYEHIFDGKDCATMLKKLREGAPHIKNASISQEKATSIIEKRRAMVLPAVETIALLENTFKKVFPEWCSGEKTDLGPFFSLCNKAEVQIQDIPDLKGSSHIQDLLSLAQVMRDLETLEQFSKDSQGLLRARFHGLWVDPLTHRLTTGRVYIKNDLSFVDKTLARIPTILAPIISLISEGKKNKIRQSLQRVESFYPYHKNIGTIAQKAIRTLIR
jgi:hypothetical protein